MTKKSFSSTYFLTKDKKLEIKEGSMTFRSSVPLRFGLNPLLFIKNLFLRLIKSKKRLRSYTVLDLKTNTQKKLYLTHTEIQQVWNHPVKEKVETKPKASFKKTKNKNKSGK